jgi:PAS domain S-box-containing protein
MSGLDGAAPVESEILEALDAPVFGCDGAGIITYGNRAFERLLEGRAVGKDGREVFGLPAGASAGEWTAPDGTRWSVTLRDRPEGAAGWLEKRTPTGEQGSFEKILGVLEQLSAEPTLPRRDEEVVQLFVKILKRILPDRLFCVRLLDVASGQLLQVLATGRLKESERNSILISKRAVEQYGVPEELTGPVSVGDEYVTLFEGAGSGFDIPLHDGRRLFGVLSVEYAGASPSIEADSRDLHCLSHLLTTTLGYARLLGETTHLRDYLIKLLDNANAPILVTDRHSRVKIINRAFERLTGYDRAEVLDKDVVKLLPVAERDRFLPTLINTLRGRSTSTLELRIPKKDGRGTAHIAISTAAVTSGFGEIEGVVAVGQDLTELRQLQQQIIHSEKLATIGQLAAGVVHELNNPLTSISVYSEFLLKKAEQEGRDVGEVTKLRRICEGADRILRFTRDLVAYARPAGEEPRLVDMVDVVQRSLVFCEHVIARAGVKVTTDFEADLPTVYGVKDQLQQILVNLITNACDALTGTDGRLQVTLRTEGEHIHLSVTDNGPGIPAQDRERIFEPFFTTKPEGKGTGLGLSIVRNIITNHNGTVKALAAEGGGTTFLIELFAQT